MYATNRCLLFIESKNVFQCSSNPTFLLNVELLGRFSTPSTSIRVCCYDVKEKLTKTKVLIGCASISIRSLMTPADNQLRLPLMYVSFPHSFIGFFGRSTLMASLMYDFSLKLLGMQWNCVSIILCASHIPDLRITKQLVSLP